MEKPGQYYDTRRCQLYYQWPQNEYYTHQEPVYDCTKKYIEALENENADLRTQLADMTERMGRAEERRAKTFEVGKRWMAKAARFEAENSRLRELARELGIEVL